MRPSDRPPLTVTLAVCTIPGRERELARALASVTAQTRTPDAVVIEPDPDRTGAGPARDRALAQVETSHVAFLDDDDELLPRHLAVLEAATVETGADVVYPWFLPDPPSADTLLVRDDGPPVSPFDRPFSPAMRGWLARGYCFLHLTALFRTSTLRAAGGFPALGPRGSQEDAGAYQALAAAGATFFHVPDRTWVWHRGAQGTAGRGAKRGPRG